MVAISERRLLATRTRQSVWDTGNLDGSEQGWGNPKRALRIGMTGHVGGGSAAINVLVETIEGILGGRAMVDVSAALAAR